ncbi:MULTISPECIES: FAD-dependent monooxygenase [unclassified Francisella]|uniref:FAD-dependent monooxygenase n=1 Tax=unclassified Francisella TaxID=2610885 RepID=UPI002E348C4A|nr:MULTISPECIES: FAD-dependent monooxygenase [unclassified Francisella]MED7818588.1 FAD-dependent monooxygenase [Francisella sp. 19S2-4]MED7829424.1 FAD-dependent monooxygenase [Francisella sp. 19S2-10]
MRIAINGAGVAGLSLAWWLEKYGFEVTVFEKKQKLPTEGYLINCWGSGYDVLKKTGLLNNIKDKVINLKHIKCYNHTAQNSNSVEVSSIIRKNYGKFISIRRSDLLSIIYNDLEKTNVIFGTSISSFEDVDDKVIVERSDGKRESFDIIIGADGFHSHIRSLTFKEEEYKDVDINTYIASFYNHDAAVHTDKDSYELFLDRDKQASLISLNDKKTSVCTFAFDKALVSTKPKTLQSKKDELKSVFKGFEGKINKILENLENVDEIFFDNVGQVKMDSWYKDRVALIGDASSAPSLLAGQGSIFALCEAYILAGELYESKGDYKKAFSEWQNKLKDIIDEKQDNSLTNLSFFMPEEIFTNYIIPMKGNLQSVPIFNQIFGAEVLRYSIDLPAYYTEAEDLQYKSI